MTDEQTDTPVDETGDPAEQTADAAEPGVDATGEPAGDAWHDIISQLDALGDAMGRWARAATHDPQNRERAHELKQHMEKMAKTVSGAVDDASTTDVGQSLRDAATKTGSAFRAAGDRVAEEASPRIAAAFRVTAEKLHQASERMERKGAEEAAGEAPESTVEDESETDGGSSED